MSLTSIDSDLLDLEDEDEELSDERERSDDLSQWRRQAVTAKAAKDYAVQRERLIEELCGMARISTDPRIVSHGARIQTLDEVVKFFGGKGKV